MQPAWLHCQRMRLNPRLYRKFYAYYMSHMSFLRFSQLLFWLTLMVDWQDVINRIPYRLLLQRLYPAGGFLIMFFFKPQHIFMWQFCFRFYHNQLVFPLPISRYICKSLNVHEVFCFDHIINFSWPSHYLDLHIRVWVIQGKYQQFGKIVNTNRI